MKKRITVKYISKTSSESIAAFERKAKIIFETEVKPSIERAKAISTPVNVVSWNNPL